MARYVALVEAARRFSHLACALCNRGHAGRQTCSPLHFESGLDTLLSLSPSFRFYILCFAGIANRWETATNLNCWMRWCKSTRKEFATTITPFKGLFFPI